MHSTGLTPNSFVATIVCEGETSNPKRKGANKMVEKSAILGAVGDCGYVVEDLTGHMVRTARCLHNTFILLLLPLLVLILILIYKIKGYSLRSNTPPTYT